MMRQHRIDPENPDVHVIQEVATLIREGKVVIVPTDTAYGLTGNPSDAQVVQRILTIKHRVAKLGMPLLAANHTQIQDLVTLPPQAEALTAEYWPGALTIIAPACREFPAGILGPQTSLAVRIPAHPVTLAVIRATGTAIIGTSANKPDHPSPRTANAAAAQLGEQVDYILDAGPTHHTADSTIINFTTHPPEIVREGAIPRSVLERLLKTANRE
ncbi:MAG: L-threonylcarbamoyladenylate synthase [Candidatus Hermodarchaeia archaeon]